MTPSARDDGQPVVDRVLCGRVGYRPGQDTVRPHGVEHWLVALTVAGAGAVWPPSGPPVPLPLHCAVAYRPGTPQRYGTAPGADGWEALWTHVRPRPEWSTLLDWPEVAPGIGVVALSSDTAARASEALETAVRRHRAGMGLAAGFTMNAVEEALLWCATERGPVDQDPYVLAVVEHVAGHLDQQHTVTSLAQLVAISPSHLAHLARRRLGTSLMAYVERLRMDSARELLQHTDLTVAQVAQRVGYPDPLHFSRRFRHVCGTPPTTFRATSAASSSRP